VHASSGDVTPRSSLLRTHSPIPVALLSFGSSPRSRSLGRVLPAPAATRTFPTLSLRILPWMPEPIPRRVAECVCLVLPQPSSAFPIIRPGRLPARLREHDFPRVGFRGCSYFVMFTPPSLLASQIVPTAASRPCRAAEAFYIRAKRASLPSHASDMLSARLQAIGGTRTFTSQDSQPCRLLPNDADVSIVPPKSRVEGWRGTPQVRPIRECAFRAIVNTDSGRC